MSARGRIVSLAAVIVIAVVGFIALKPSDSKKSSSTTTTTTATTANGQPIADVRVQGGKPAGGVQNLTFNKGDTVQFKVTSDVADEVHVHGYDFHKNVAPGHPVTFKFPAKIDGEFVVELESRGEQIASLKVNP